MERDEVKAAVRAAFAGVRLGGGRSLRQAQAQDSEDWAAFESAGLIDASWRAQPGAEVTDDWALVPESELRRDSTARLDEEGLRYYLPAFMLWLLDHYDDEETRLFDYGGQSAIIGTISAVAPGKEARAARYAMFDGWTPQQRAAIAAYVEALPRLVELAHEDATLVERAVRDYWGRFLPRG